MFEKNGFTIVELLVTIVVLTLIFSIVGVTVNNIIENSKDNSTATAINNLKKGANMYSKEYSEELIWESFIENANNLEKTCISTEMLIAKGYFEKSINDDNKTPKSIIIIKDKDNNIIKEKAEYIDCENYNKNIEIPTIKNICYDITYDGLPHHLINESNKSEFYSSMEYVNPTYNNETNRPINAGEYEVKISLIEGKKWSDNTDDAKFVTCKINKATPTLTLNPNGNSDTPDKIGIKDIILTSNTGGTLELKTSNDKHAVASVENNIMEENPTNPNEKIKTIKINTISTRNTLTYITIKLKSNNSNYKDGSIKYTIGKIETKKVAKPVCNNLTYNGNMQNLINENEAYKLYNNTGIDYDTYTVKASLNYGYVWEDNTYDQIEFNCIIKKPTPTVTYKNATCNPTSKVVTYKDTYGTLCTPTKTGHTFIGWYSDENLTNAVTSSTIVNNFNNHNLYAKWQVHKIYIKYNTNRGKVTGTNTAYTQSGDNVLKNGNAIVQTYDYGATGIDLANYNNSSHLYITKTGYNAVSGSQWNTKTDGTGKSYNQATEYKASDLCNADTANCTVLLYVNWVDNIKPTCSITYRTGGSSWVTNGVDITINCSDSGSGCTTASSNKNDVTSDKTYTVTDNAGNSGTCKLDIKTRTRYRKQTRSWISECTSTCKGGYVCSGAGTALCSGGGLKVIDGKCCYWDDCKTKTWSGCYSSWSSWSSYSHSSCTESSTVNCGSRKEYTKNS